MSSVPRNGAPEMGPRAPDANASPLDGLWRAAHLGPISLGQGSLLCLPLYRVLSQPSHDHPSLCRLEPQR